MVTQACRCPGVSLLSSRAVVDLVSVGGRVKGVKLSDGASLPADLVIGCDGRGSLVRRRSHLAFTPGDSTIDVLWFRLQPPWSDAMADWLGDQFLTCLGDHGSFSLFTTATGGVQLGWALERRGRQRAPDRQRRGDHWQAVWSSCSPPDLARCFQALPDEGIEGPVQLPVQVGLVEPWHRPGLLLLGDAAHPMSPLRAQGINMALRDAAAAAGVLRNRLTRAGAGAGDSSDLDASLATIQAERIQEIRTIQALQAREARRAELLRNNGWLRRLLVRSAPWSTTMLARHWIHDQRTLREGSSNLPAWI
jgi:2-polyprenyl-6-methoxyphenol hydroxylase-like FAD-dependent oxidoreductase